MNAIYDLAQLRLIYEQNRIEITKEFKVLRNKEYELYSKHSLEEAKEFLKMYFQDMGINTLDCKCPVDNLAYLLVASADMTKLKN